MSTKATDEDGTKIETLGEEVKLVRGIWYSDGVPYRRWIPAYQNNGTWLGHDDAKVVSYVDVVLEMSALDSHLDIWPIFDILERLFRSGHRIAEQDGLWWLFDADGEGVASGRTVRELCVHILENL